MVQGKCRTCGEIIRSRASKNGSARGNFLKAMRNHYKQKHPNTIPRRISKALRERDENPSVQDLIDALTSGPREAIEVYKRYTERQYQATKKVMDALEPVLPENIKIAWKVVEALHDTEK